MDTQGDVEEHSYLSDREIELDDIVFTLVESKTRTLQDIYHDKKKETQPTIDSFIKGMKASR